VQNTTPLRYNQVWEGSVQILILPILLCTSNMNIYDNFTCLFKVFFIVNEGSLSEDSKKCLEIHKSHMHGSVL